MNNKIGFGNTHHFTLTPTFFTPNYYDFIIDILENNFKTGLDKITIDKFKEIKNTEYDIIHRKISNMSYNFTRFKKIKTNNGRIAHIPTIRDRIVLEYLKQKLESYFYPKYPNRENISDLIKSKLSFGQELHIFRYDIKSFFETIPHQILLKKIKSKKILSYYDYALLVNFLNSYSNIGLPIGISVNNILSEIFLSDIDKEILSTHSSITMYCRYVDDIIIIFNGNLRDKEKGYMDSKIVSIFKKSGLNLNTGSDKRQVVKISKKNVSHFNFLGYKYIYDKGILRIGITDNKRKLLLSKINFIFDSYLRNQNDILLLERLSYLTKTNTMIKYIRSSKGIMRPKFIKYGVIENYKNVGIDTWATLDNIITFRIFKDLKIIIKDENKRRMLFKLRFKSNFLYKQKNNFHKYTNNDFISLIKQIDPSINIIHLNKLNRNKLELLYKEKLCL